MQLRRFRPYSFTSMPTTQSSIRRPPTKKTFSLGDLVLWDSKFWSLFCSDSSLYTSSNSCNSCCLRIIVKFLLPLVFPIKDFHIKSCTFLCFIYVHYPTSFLACDKDRPSTCEKSQPETGVVIEFESTLKISVPSNSKSSSKSLFSQHWWSQKRELTPSTTRHHGGW